MFICKLSIFVGEVGGKFTEVLITTYFESFETMTDTAIDGV